MHLNDEDLVSRAKEFDPVALGTIYENYFDRIFRYVLFRVRDKTEAEDITEQVFLKCLESISGFNWRGTPVSAWLFRIAHNQIIDFFRRSKKQVSLSLDLTKADSKIDPVVVFEAKMKRQDLLQAVDGLTDLQRTVIGLRFAGSLSIADTAKIMGKSENAVKAAQHDALAALRRNLNKEL